MKRPTKPLTTYPGAYFQLESYSSLQRLWMLLEGAERAGRKVRLQRGDTEETCRRVIEGYSVERAGGLLDERRALEEDDITLHPALIALAARDFGPLKDTLTEDYSLHFSFTLAFTKNRTLVLKASAVYKAHPRQNMQTLDQVFTIENFSDLELEPILPDSVKFYPRRFSKEDWRILLERACGVRV